MQLWSMIGPADMSRFYPLQTGVTLLPAGCGRGRTSEGACVYEIGPNVGRMHREDLREATRKAAERRRRQREQLSPFNRLRPGEKKHAKRMATVAAVYAVAPFVRSPEEIPAELPTRRCRTLACMKLEYGVGADAGTEVGFHDSAESPLQSWTRSPASTPYCETGSPGERAL